MMCVCLQVSTHFVKNVEMKKGFSPFVKFGKYVCRRRYTWEQLWIPQPAAAATTKKAAAAATPKIKAVNVAGGASIYTTTTTFKAALTRLFHAPFTTNKKQPRISLLGSSLESVAKTWCCVNRLWPPYL